MSASSGSTPQLVACSALDLRFDGTLEELQMRNDKKRALAAMLFVSAFVISGCAHEDRRLAEDQQSCIQMGHSPGTPQFNQCMEDLNQRRCATVAAKGAGERHVATEECTRLK
jgi:hypothetical protein